MLLLPPGHTAYSWGEGGDQPLGHTKFSWTAGCAVCGGDSKTMGGEGEEKKPPNSNSNAAAVKKGFLEPRVEPVGNLSDFLRKHVPDVLRRADELHRTAEEDEGNPFKNKYAARELLKGALLQFVACQEEASATGLEGEWEEAIARVEHLMGVNLVETEEISGGEKTIVACIERMKKCGEDKFVAEILDMSNHLGLIWSQRAEHAKAEGFLVQATELYEAWKKKGLAKSSSEAEMNQVEGLRTTTLFLMAQVYQHLGHPDMSAKYCTITLNRSLGGSTFEPHEWIKNAIQLSGFYLSQGRYRDSATCLAASEVVWKRVPAGGVDEPESRETRGNLDWGWGKLHMTRLDDAANGVGRTLGKHEAVVFDLEELDKLIPTYVEDLVESYADACRDMKASLSRLDRVRVAFPIDEDATNHIQACQDLSRLYKALTHFTESGDDRCKMNKRRIDTLEPIVTQLSVAAFDSLCKELRYELGEAYRDMMEIKISQVESGEKKIKWEKIADLCDGATRHFRAFVSLFLAVPNDPESPKNEVQGLGEEKVRRWYLCARFYLARVLLKRPDADVDRRRVHITAALNEYKAIVKLAESKTMAFKGKEFSFAEELKICKEMVALLPAKIERLHMLDAGKSGTA